MTAARALCCALLLALAGCALPPDGGAPPASPSSSSSSPSPSPTAGGAEGAPTASFVVDGGRRATVALEVADSPAERERGLMGRRSLPPDRGMAFVYGDAAPRTFWMKNTYVPLDIVFVGPGGRVLNVAHAAPQPDAPESDLRRYRSDGPAKYVIEVNRGFANRTGVDPGSRVAFENATFETPGGRR